MTTAELTVVAALGASFLTGLASLGVMAFQEWLRGRSADQDALASAVIEMLTRSLAVSMRAQAMAETMRIRSGLGEGVDIATRLRKPLDLFEFHDWMAQDMAPLNTAWSVIWTRGDQEMVRLANALLSACSDLIGISTTTQQTDSNWERLKRFVVGERWTPEQRADNDRAMVQVAHARKRLAEHARRKLGKPYVELFGHAEPGDSDGGAVSTAELAGDQAQAAPPEGI